MRRLIVYLQRKSQYKKVLLRERKRHTARRVASTPYVVLTGYPPSPGRVPPPTRVPPSRQGTPPPGYPPPGRVPPHQGTPPRVPPPGWTWQGTPPPHQLPHGILGNVAKHYGIWVPPPPPHRCEQTENITFPHPSDAGGKKFDRMKRNRRK